MKLPQEAGSTRREMLQGAAAFGLLAAFGGSEAQAADDDRGDADAGERGHVMAAGMTEAEAACWLAAADTAGKFFALPEMHPMDKQEVATAIHVIQNKLLGRPTYRKYLESHGAPGHGEKK